VALSQSMAASTTNPTLKRMVILAALLLAVITSGFSQIEVHSHSDAYFGHTHDPHDHDEPHGENSGDLGEPGNTGVAHMHDTGTTPLTLVSAINLEIATFHRADDGVSAPITKPPDIAIAPLYRPPIV